MAHKTAAKVVTMAATQPEPEPAALEDGGFIVAVTATPQPTVPPGYEARLIVWPAHFWRIFDRQSARAQITTSKWLERQLQHIARE